MRLMESDSRGLSRVLDAYIRFLGSVAPVVTYLVFLVASIVGAWSTTLAFAIFGVTPLAAVLFIVSFTLPFTLATYVMLLIFRVADSYEQLRLSGEARESYKKEVRRRNILLGWGWIVPFATLVPASYYFIPWPYTVPVAVSLGVGAGNVISALIVRKYGGDYLASLFAGPYLILTATLYFYLPLQSATLGQTLEFALLTVNLSVSYFGAAIIQTFKARSQVTEVLHAAR